MYTSVQLYTSVHLFLGKINNHESESESKD
jgi:hypothetical protein